MAGKIFINYRRGDDPGHTGRLFDRLQDVFEPQQLFLDVDNIAPGVDFIRELNERIAACDVVLAVIGKGWIDARDDAGLRRLDDPNDFVRIEIGSALQQGKRVIPVLVNDAPMPRPEELPDELRPLVRRNAVRLTHERFRADTQGLIKALQHSLDEIEARHQAEAEAARRAHAEAERLRQEAEAERRAEEKERQRQAEEEARRRAADERRRQEAEARQRAETERAFAAAKRTGTVAALDAFLAAHAASSFAEEARSLKAAIVAREEAAQRAADDRRRQEAEAKQRAETGREFAAAKRAGTVLALDAFLAAHGADALAEDARKLKAVLATREEAYLRAAASDDVTLLRSFLITYKHGADVDRLRTRLRTLEPQPRRRLPKPAVVIATALAGAAILATLVFWREHGPPPLVAEPTVAPVPSPQIAAPVPPAMAVPSPDEIAWSLLEGTTDEAAIKRFIAQFPDSKLRKVAEARLAALEAAQATQPAPLPADQIAWDLVKDTKDPDQLRRFIAQFPNSVHRSEAEQRLAALSPAAPTPGAAPAIDPHELARSLQFELKRVGCFDGTVNGEFDDPTRASWQQFIKLTSVSVPDPLSTEAINAVRGFNKRVCPLTCPAGKHANGDACIANEPPPAPRPPAAPAQQPPKAPAAPAVVDVRGKPPGTVTAGGVTVCGRNGCQLVPKNCHAVSGAGGHGLGGKIVCP
jgi:hypothetical protein